MKSIDRTKILVLAAAAFGVSVAGCSREASTGAATAQPSNVSTGGAGNHQGSCGSCGAADGGARATQAQRGSAQQGSCGSCGAADGGARGARTAANGASAHQGSCGSCGAADASH